MAGTKVVVFGGNGFVGSHILQALAARASPSNLVSLSRSGAMPKHLHRAEWAQGVEWAKADCMEPETYSSALKDADAVVIAVGSPPVPFVDEQWQTMMNGGKRQ